MRFTGPLPRPWTVNSIVVGMFRHSSSAACVGLQRTGRGIDGEGVAESARSGVALKLDCQDRWPASNLYPPGVSTSPAAESSLRLSSTVISARIARITAVLPDPAHALIVHPCSLFLTMPVHLMFSPILGQFLHPGQFGRRYVLPTRLQN